jgi:hypothetical protein
MPNRNFKRLPGQRFETVNKLDDELDNVYKQLNLFSAEVVVSDTSKDLFEIQKYNKLLKINKDTATLGDVIDFVATLSIKLGELKAIKVKVKGG